MTHQNYLAPVSYCITEPVLSACMLSLDFVLVDATDHGVTVDQNMVWHCYIHESIPLPNLINDEVYETANLILQTNIGIDRSNINVNNCLNVFKFLVKCFS